MFADMSAKITITLSDDVLKALRTKKSLTLKVDSQAGGRGASQGTSELPREGSLPARVIDWASARNKSFSTSDVSRRFRLSRAHSSMLLSRLANGPYPIERSKRGVYTYSG